MQKNNTNKMLVSSWVFLATVLVVICHADFYVLSNINDIVNDGWVARIIRFISGPFAAANVSNFFLLSGYFIGKHVFESGWWTRAVVKRMKTLVVPYLFINVVVFLVVVGGESVIQLLRGIALQSTVIGEYMTPFSAGLTKLFGIGLRPVPTGSAPYDIPLWYIKALLSFIILSPLPVAALRKSRLNIVPIAIIGWILVTTQCGAPVFYRLFMGADVFHFTIFTIGIYFAITPTPIPRFPAMVVVPIATSLWICSALLFNASSGTLRSILYPMNICVGMGALFIMLASVNKIIPKVICSTSFFIYVEHLPILCGLGRVLRTISRSISIDSSGGVIIAIYITFIVVTVGFCVLLSLALRRMFPLAYHTLSGGR